MSSSSAARKEVSPFQIKRSKTTKMEPHAFVAVFVTSCAFRRTLWDWLISSYAWVKQLSQDYNHITNGQHTHTHWRHAFRGVCSCFGGGKTMRVTNRRGSERRPCHLNLSSGTSKSRCKTQANVKAELWLSWTHFYFPVGGKCFALSYSVAHAKTMYVVKVKVEIIIYIIIIFHFLFF